MSDTYIDWFALIAKDRGCPENWRWYQSEVKGERPHHVFIVRGGVPGAVFKSGKYKGKPNPTKYTDRRELVITDADMNAVKARWESETGKCSGCYGEGKTIASAHADGTRTYRDCKPCGATGLIASIRPVEGGVE